jgi:hypothetical protein
MLSRLFSLITFIVTSTNIFCQSVDYSNVDTSKFDKNDLSKILGFCIPNRTGQQKIVLLEKFEESKYIAIADKYEINDLSFNHLLVLKKDKNKFSKLIMTDYKGEPNVYFTDSLIIVGDTEKIEFYSKYHKSFEDTELHWAGLYQVYLIKNFKLEISSSEMRYFYDYKKQILYLNKKKGTSKKIDKFKIIGEKLVFIKD